MAALPPKWFPEHNNRKIKPLARALLYPYPAPTGDFYMQDGSLFLVPEGIRADKLRGRIPVLGVGSNCAPLQLRRKFRKEAFLQLGLKFDKEDFVPVTAATVKGVDVVFAAHLSSYCAVPATAVASLGTRVMLNIAWLNKDQLKVMDKSEGLKSASERLESASEGLKSASEGLKIASERLKSASEGLKSASEGLESASEGLESASEGLKSASERSKSAYNRICYNKGVVTHGCRPDGDDEVFNQSIYGYEACNGVLEIDGGAVAHAGIRAEGRHLPEMNQTMMFEKLRPLLDGVDMPGDMPLEEWINHMLKYGCQRIACAKVIKSMALPKTLGNPWEVVDDKICDCHNQ